jgi:putative ABC transport system permease protein
MNIVFISFKNVIAKPLSSLLSILLFGFGVSIIVVILLTSSFLKREINKNAGGIDLVVGAKGSPLQIILASVFHIDFPTGNISLKDASDLAKNRLIASAIPLSLGDSFRGFRIVGTTNNYLELYNTQLEEGIPFGDKMTVVIGNNVAKDLMLKIGDEIQSDHGLSDGSGGHDDHPYTVVGIIKPTGNVTDKLIITSIQSVWEVHGHDEEKVDESQELLPIKKLGIEITRRQLEDEDITSLFIKYRSPMAAVQLPRIVNSTSNLQAASPPFETARLFNIIGVGVEVVNILGIVIIILSAISVFIALFNSLKERKYELAIMRSMGAGRKMIFLLILVEGFVLTLIGSMFGFTLAHAGFEVLGASVGQFNASGLFFVEEEYYVFAGSIVVGIFASLIPAIIAYRSDISKTLSKG